MAVIQISKIQVRRGLQEDLPQLAAGELGYSTDQRRVWIGNGLLGDPDYAPETGNTEILTIYSPVGAALSNIAVLEEQVNAIESDVAELQSAVGTSVLFDWHDPSTTPAEAFRVSTTTPFTVDYRIKRDTIDRVGKLTITSLGSAINFSDEYTEASSTDVSLTVEITGSNTIIKYSTLSSGALSSANVALWHRLPITFN